MVLGTLIIAMPLIVFLGYLKVSLEKSLDLLKFLMVIGLNRKIITIYLAGVHSLLGVQIFIK